MILGIGRSLRRWINGPNASFSHQPLNTLAVDLYALFLKGYVNAPVAIKRIVFPDLTDLVQENLIAIARLFGLVIKARAI